MSREVRMLPGVPCPHCESRSGLRLVVNGNSCKLICVDCRVTNDPVTMSEMATMVSGIMERSTEVRSISRSWLEEHILEALNYED